MATHDLREANGLEIANAPEAVSSPFWNMWLYSAKSPLKGVGP
jgi:hypothetical protein